MAQLSGAVAIVTGGARGIGGATARRLARDGASVLIVDVDLETAEQNVARIRAEGGTASASRADVGQVEDVRRMVEQAVQQYGKLTILINNAYNPVGGEDGGTAVEVTEAAWDKGLAVLMRSIYLGAKFAVPEMEKAGGGSIVNLSSVHGLLYAPGMLIYEAGKTAVIGMTKQMACDFGPRGIRVNAICPGHIVTERIQAAMWDNNPGGLRFWDQQYPVRRTGRPDDIANAIAFLCSDDASFITGHALVVDGGLSIQLQENLGVHLAEWIQEHPDVQLP